MDMSKYKPNGTSWSPEEDEELNNMYNEKLMDINEISNIINRTPGCIISRLCKNKYIPNRTSARGYIIYKNSDLYKSIVASGEGRKNNKQSTKSNDKQTTKSNDNISININGINTCEIVGLKNEILELKNDVNQIKNGIEDLKNQLRELAEIIKVANHSGNILFEMYNNKK